MEKIEKKIKVVSIMIKIYCKKNHSQKELCKSCSELLDYAKSRAERCRYKETEISCQSCKTHCYKPEMKLKIKMVMRFSGPRMILYHPIVAIKHLIYTKKVKR